MFWESCWEDDLAVCKGSGRNDSSEFWWIWKLFVGPTCGGLLLAVAGGVVVNWRFEGVIRLWIAYWRKNKLWRLFCIKIDICVVQKMVKFADKWIK